MGAEQDCPGLRCEWEYDRGVAVKSCYRQTGWEEVERKRWATKGKYGLKRGYLKLWKRQVYMLQRRSSRKSKYRREGKFF